MSSKRREARRWAVQFLFQRDFNQGDITEAFEDFWADEERNSQADTRKFTEQLAHGVESHLDEIDSTLQRFARNWNISRMAAVDRNVMRMALFEMLYRPDIPPVVSINEAVELAKEFSGAESGRFVNGVLDQARKTLGRPAREAVKPDAPKLVLPVNKED